MTSDEKRDTYNSASSAVRKELAERELFLRFKDAARFEIDIESEKNEKPPLPDISCTVDGTRYFFELGRIEDEELARDISVSVNKGEDTVGGWFSEEEPLVRIIRNKTRISYPTNGAPVDLVLYYDRQYPNAPGECINKFSSQLAEALAAGRFTRIWIYDNWTKMILWGGRADVSAKAK